MQTTTEQVTTRPFHETIVDAINEASTAQMVCLATLIRATKVPKGHDEIITAWNTRLAAMSWDDKDFGVSANLLEQKVDSAKKSDDGKEDTNLDS